jgi:hypothetical protein
MNIFQYMMLFQEAKAGCAATLCGRCSIWTFGAMLLFLNAYAHKSMALGVNRKSGEHCHSFVELWKDGCAHRMALMLAPPPALSDHQPNSSFGLAIAEVQDFWLGIHQTAAFTTKQPFSPSQGSADVSLGIGQSPQQGQVGIDFIHQSLQGFVHPVLWIFPSFFHILTQHNRAGFGS